MVSWWFSFYSPSITRVFREIPSPSSPTTTDHLITRHLYKPRSFCRSAYSSLMMEAVRTSETSVDNHFTWQYNPRRQLWTSYSPPWELEISHSSLIGITKCTKLRSRIWERDLWHNVHTKYSEFPPSVSLVTKYAHTGITCEEVGLGLVRLRMRTHMRRWSWIVASSTFHLTTSRNCHVSIMECRKLKCRIYRSYLQHNVLTKFHEYTSNHSLVIKRVKTDITSKASSSPNVTILSIRHVSTAYCMKFKSGILDVLKRVTSTLNTTKIRSPVHDMSKTTIRKVALPLYNTGHIGSPPCYNSFGKKVTQFHGYFFSIHQSINVHIL
jgi:hypothetical protein